MTSRPAKPLRWADNVGGGLPGRVEPTEAAKDDGWDSDDAPGAGEHNWALGLAGDWIAYLDRSLDAARRSVVDEHQDPITEGTYNSICLVPEPAAGAAPILLAQDSTGLSYSYDGVNWIACANNPSAATVQIKVDTTVSPNRVMVIANGQIQYTQDVRDGTWTAKSLPSGNAAWFEWSDDAGEGVVCNTATFNVYRFTDITAGSPFTAATTDPPSGGIDGFAYCPDLSRWVCMASTDYGTDQPFAYSDDSGDNWSLCTALSGSPDPQGSNRPSVVWLPGGGSDGAGRFFAFVEEGTTDPNPRLYESTNGIAWTDVSSRFDYFFEQGVWADSVNELVVLAPRIAIVCVRPTDNSGRAAALTSDGGVTWAPVWLNAIEVGVNGRADSAAAIDGRIVINGYGNSNRRIWRTVTL